MNKSALQKCSYGVYIVSSRKDGKLNGQIANTVFQVTSEPPTISVCINKANLTHDMIMSSRAFAISILCEEAPMEFIGRFGYKSGRDIDKFEGINFRLGKTEMPIVVDHSAGFMECELTGTMDVGTHTIFVGRVIDADVILDSRPMTYDYYHKVKGGKSPKTAPTYDAGPSQEPKQAQKEAATMDSYKCNVCGYVYDPAVGDESAGIGPGVDFNDLPDSWVCPVCGAPKSEFEKVG
jgi:flavin reductase (DIM6/NTAB) family NADH-FMN oxidoreductase RutF/rubredoxin